MRLPCHVLSASLLIAASLLSGRAAADAVPVIHCTDLYHPHDDPDDHFDLATMYALPGIDLKAVILDNGQKQTQRPGSIAVRQLNHITGRAIPWAVGLSRNLSRPDDKLLEEAPDYQAGVETILRVLRESPGRVSIVTLGACRDVAAACNRDPDLLRRKLDKLMIFIGEADEKKQDYREYNVSLDRNAYICLLRSGLPVYWVPCFDGGLFKNNGRASFWLAKHSDLLSRCRPQVIQYFIYALEKKNPLTEEPLEFLAKPPNAAERDRLMAGKRNLWCAAVFVHLAGKQIVQQDGRWQAVPIGSAKDARPVFDFREVQVSVGDDAATGYGASFPPQKIMQFQVLDLPNYPAAMTAVSADLLADLGKIGPE